MNTRLLKSFAVAAMSVLAIACAKEQVGSGDGAMVEATFSLDVPEAVGTKAIGDGLTASKLYYQVFDDKSNPIEGLGVQTKKMNSGKTTVTFQLVKDQTYNFIFWAQTPLDGYYEIDGIEGLKKISAKYADKNANDENFDAFYAVEKLTINGSISEAVTLTRPFAQVNIATTGKLAAGTASKDLDFEGATSTVTFKNIPTEFSPLSSDDVVDGTESVVFASAAVPEGNITVADKEYKYLSMNYVFAPKNGSVYDVAAELTVAGKTVSVSVPNVPLKRNWRTNIVGNLLLTGAQFNVIVDPVFENEETMAYDEEAFRAAVAAGGKVSLSQDMTLTKPLSLTKSTATEIVIGKDVTLTAELSGYYSKIISLFKENINCTLSGDGIILGPTVKNASASAAIEIEDNTNNLVIDGNLTIAGRNGTTAGNVDAGIIIRAGKVTVNSGHFIASKDVDGGENPAILLYSPYSYRSELIINGGTFESVVGNSKFLINIQDEYRDHASVKIYGGTFIGFNPADNNADGEHTNYVAEGYHSTKVSTDENGVSTYVVSKEGTIPVVNQEGFKNAVAQENATIVVPAGTFTAPASVANGVTIEGVEGTVIDIPTAVAYHDKNLTFKNVTMKSPNADFTGIQHAASVKYVDCTIEGQPFSYADNAVFEKCTFNQTSSGSYNIWTYGSKNITFNNCVFNCAGKSVLIYNEGAISTSIVTFDKCKFVASESVAGKAAIEIDSRFTSYEVYINGCTHDGFANGSVSGNSLWNKKDGDKSVKVFVDGTQVL